MQEIAKNADLRRKPQIGLRHLKSVTFSSALHSVTQDENSLKIKFLFRDIRDPDGGISLTPACRFRQGMAGMSHDSGRDVLGLGYSPGAFGKT